MSSSSSLSSSGAVSTTVVKSEETSEFSVQDADHTAYLKLWGSRGTRNESFVEYVERLPCILGRVKASENHVQIAGSDTSVSRKHTTIAGYAEEDVLTDCVWQEWVHCLWKALFKRLCSHSLEKWMPCKNWKQLLRHSCDKARCAHHRHDCRRFP